MFHPVELINEWETRTNRLLGRPRNTPGLVDLWSEPDDMRGEVAKLGDAEPELMVVIMTYDRPSSAARLLGDLGAALRKRSLFEGTALLVLHDACQRDYTAARAQARAIAPRRLWLDACQRFGKAGFWRMHQTAMDVARAWRPKRTLYLQDDVEFEPDLLERADHIWRATARDPLRRALYLFSSRDDERDGRWVSFRRREMPNAPYRITNWLDLQAFVVDRQFFELLDYRMVHIHPNRWKRRPDQSSGVGRQLSHRLFGRANVYQAWPPLVAHGSEPSRMNPQARQKRSLDNYDDFKWTTRRPPRDGSQEHPSHDQGTIAHSL